VTDLSYTFPSPLDQAVMRPRDHEDRISRLERLLAESESAGLERRNMVDNAAALTAQRTLVSSISTNVSGYFTADRWPIAHQVTGGPTIPTLEYAVTDVLTPTGLDKAFRVTCTANPKSALAAGDYAILYHPVEGMTFRATQALADYYNLKATTCSFWVNPTFAGTFVLEFILFAQSGPQLQQISRSFTLVANVWQKVTLDIPSTNTGATAIASTTNTAAVLYFWMAAGSNYTSGSLNTNWSASPVASSVRAGGVSNLVGATGRSILLTNVQWEVGTASSFERLHAADDLRQCMRYFQRHQAPVGRGASAGAGSPTVGRLGMSLPVPMRINPALSFAGTIGLYDGTISWAVSSLSANLSTNPSVVEFDAQATGNWPVAGRAIMMYQGLGGFLDCIADL
jgi:hypothetical protein